MVELRERPEEAKISQGGAKNVFLKEHWHPKILSCQISPEKITVQLADQREISLPWNLIFKEWFLQNDIKPNQLKNYKIWGGGYTIMFPDLDEDIPVRIFTEGINSPCCC